MHHNYTRQRQGRDFPAVNPHDEQEKNKSMLRRLEYFIKKTEQNAVPVDGHEPPLEHPTAERGRG